MPETLPLLLALAIIISSAKLAGYLATRLHQPAVLGELLVGLLLGPSLLDLFHLPLLSGGHTEETVHALAELGVIFLMFVAGLEVDLGEMLRSGKVALLAGNLGVLVPLLGGFALALAFGRDLYPALFVGLILTATSVSISAQTLLELGVLRTRAGLALLGAAVVDDVVAILALSLFLALTGTGAGARPLILVLVLMLAFFFVAVLVAARLFSPFIRLVNHLPVSEGVLSAVVVITLLFAWSAEAVGGVAAITGAFIAGVFFGRTRFRAEIERGMHTLTYAFFVPVFLVSIGLRADLRDLDLAGLVFLVALILVAILTKILGSALGARLGGFDKSNSLRVGLGMVSRGEVGLIVTTIGLNAGLVTPAEYSEVVIMVLATTLITPLILRRAYASDHAVSTREPAL